MYAAILFATIAMYCIWSKSASIARQIHLHRIQNRCLYSALPWDAVVYDDASHDNVIASDSRAVAMRSAYNTYSTLSPPPATKPFSQPYALASFEWIELVNHRLGWIFTVAFSHEVRSPAGHERLVVIPIVLHQGDTMRVIDFDYLTLIPQSIWKAWPCQVEGSSTFPPVTIQLTPDDHLLIYSGKVDPLNASHFVIPLQLNGNPGAIDGWLNDDGSIRLLRR